MQHEGLPEKTVVRLAVVSEGALLLLSVAWAWGREMHFAVDFGWPAIWQGMRATGPLIAFNFGVFGILANSGPRYAVYRDFRDQIVYPLCKNLSVVAALILAVCSGVAEELLFRGVMHRETAAIMPVLPAAIIVSFLFAYVHFIGVFKRFFPVFLIYFLFGLYFAYLVEWTGNIAVPIIAHGGYNFLAIIMIKYFAAPKTPQQ